MSQTSKNLKEVKCMAEADNVIIKQLEKIKDEIDTIILNLTNGSEN
jgi:hypothetical protein